MSTASSTNPPRVGLDSPLLRKAQRLGLRLPLDLERLAVERGCNYYERDLQPRVPPLKDVRFSNAELAIALVVPSLPPTAREVRLAAAMLAAPDVQVDEVATLAIQEECADVIRHIASCGRRFETENPFWPSLLARLPEVEVNVDELPHPTRFVEMTGINRGTVGVFTRWIRPRRPVAA